MVSRNALPPTGDHQPKIADPAKAKDVGLAVITYGDGWATCSCAGWSGMHRRAKVLEDMIDRHLNRKHDGRGIRL